MAASGLPAIPMLMSMSLAIPSEDDSSSDANPFVSASSAFVVKNTFLEVAEDDDVHFQVLPGRRSKSAPASPRAAAALQTTFLDQCVTRLGLPQRSQSDEDVTRLASSCGDVTPSDATPSTKVGSPAHAWSSTSDTTDAEDHDDSHTETSTTDVEDNDEPGTVTITKVAEDKDDPGTENVASVAEDEDDLGKETGTKVGSGSCPGSESPDSDGVPIALSSLLQKHLAQQPPRVALSSKANLYTPKGLGTSVTLPADVKTQFAKVLAAGQSALGSCFFVDRAQLNERAGGWSLTGVTRSGLSQQVRLIFTTVQKAILEAAKLSDKVYVIGYEKTPFTAATYGCGFSFRLALVQDESSACWESIASGQCSHPSSCRRKHPFWQASVDVSLTRRQ